MSENQGPSDSTGRLEDPLRGPRGVTTRRRQQTDTDQPPAENPYAAAAPMGDQDDTPERVSDSRAASSRRSPVLTILTWSAVCGGAAVPSFVAGMAVTGGQYAGMIVVILIFVAIYCAGDWSTRDRRWRQDPAVRTMLRSTYAVRLAVSAVFPVGFSLDIFCGILAVPFSEMLTGGRLTGPDRPPGFGVCVITTLVQGALMNGVLAVVALALYPVVRWVGATGRVKTTSDASVNRS